MRYIRSMDGLGRIKANKLYKPLIGNYYYKPQLEKKEESEDTKIRREINQIIINMMKEKRGNIEIQIYLANMYPNYSKYIVKMINHHTSKLNSNELSSSNDMENGDER